MDAVEVTQQAQIVQPAPPVDPPVAGPPEAPVAGPPVLRVVYLGRDGVPAVHEGGVLGVARLSGIPGALGDSRGLFLRTETGPRWVAEGRLVLVEDVES